MIDEKLINEMLAEFLDEVSGEIWDCEGNIEFISKDLAYLNGVADFAKRLKKHCQKEQTDD